MSEPEVARSRPYLGLGFRQNLAWYRFVRRVWDVAFKVVFGLEVIGRERVPTSGAVIIAPVHLSDLDPPLIGSQVPRYMRTMAKEELFKGIMGKVIYSVGTFPVQRGSVDPAALKVALDTLQKGGCLLLFPEGHRGDGVRLGSVKPGFVLLADRADAAVVPVGISGAEKVFGTLGRKFTRPRLKVVFGSPFRVSEVPLDGRKKREAVTEELTKRLLEATREAGLSLKAPTVSEPEG